jgi:hypothetical protein
MPPGISTSDFYYILPELVLTAGRSAADRRRAAAEEPGGARRWLGHDPGAGRDAVALAPFASTHVEVAGGLLAVDRFAPLLQDRLLFAPP